tara:strand:- start:1231 stop:1401 length:171 start_codon:yes stop_codon:yes gene_type:complete
MVMDGFICLYKSITIVPAIGHSFNSLSRFATTSVIRLDEAINSLSEEAGMRKDSRI